MIRCWLLMCNVHVDVYSTVSVFLAAFGAARCARFQAEMKKLVTPWTTSLKSTQKFLLDTTPKVKSWASMDSDAFNEMFSTGYPVLTLTDVKSFDTFFARVPGKVAEYTPCVAAIVACLKTGADKGPFCKKVFDSIGSKLPDGLKTQLKKCSES